MSAAATTDTRVLEFERTFNEYDADFRRRKGAAADAPHRVAYEKLVRT